MKKEELAKRLRANAAQSSNNVEDLLGDINHKIDHLIELQQELRSLFPNEWSNTLYYGGKDDE